MQRYAYLKYQPIYLEIITHKILQNDNLFLHSNQFQKAAAKVTATAIVAKLIEYISFNFS
jgi:hypothetical protein